MLNLLLGRPVPAPNVPPPRVQRGCGCADVPASPKLYCNAARKIMAGIEVFSRGFGNFFF